MGYFSRNVAVPTVRALDRKVGEEIVRDVGQAADRSFCISPERSSPSLVWQDLSLRGYHSRRPVTTVDKVVSVCFSLLSTGRLSLGEDKGGQGGGDSHSPHVGKEVLVCPLASDGI